MSAPGNDAPSGPLATIRRHRAREPWQSDALDDAGVTRLRELIGLGSEPETVVDLGCGNGRYMDALRRIHPDARIVGFDVVPANVEAAAARGFEAHLLATDRCELPLDDASVDLVFSSNVVEHMPRPVAEQALAEVARVLRPGGTFAVGAPNYPFKRFYDLRKAVSNRRHFWYYLLDDPTHVFRHGVRTMERMLAVHFVDVDLRGSRLALDGLVPWLRTPRALRRLRRVADKYFGTCRRPE